MTDRLAGQVAWITGAGSGIGQASAIVLASAGAKVVLSGRREANLLETAAIIASEGGEAMIAAADMGRSDSVEQCATQMFNRFGRCDILVNSAGINIRERAWGTVSPEGFDQVLATDLNACFYTSNAVLAAMRRQGGGLMIHVSSWSGQYVTPGQGPAYLAAKHGLVAMSESLNQIEYVNNIRSCCLCPAEVATPILDHRPVPVTAERKARMLQSEDIASIVLYVAQAPSRVCLNEILVSPTWNSAYAG